MVTLTIECSRCSKTVSEDMTNRTLANDLITKFGFMYLHNGKTNVIICRNCEKEYRNLKDKLSQSADVEISKFFKELNNAS